MNHSDEIWVARLAIMAMCRVRPGLHDERARCRECMAAHDAIDNLVLAMAASKDRTIDFRPRQ